MNLQENIKISASRETETNIFNIVYINEFWVWLKIENHMHDLNI